MEFRAAAAIAIFVLALLGILLRPRDLSEAVFALIGGVLMLAIGVVSPAQAAQKLAANWNVFLFFLGLFTISSIADLAGIFDWLADRAARLSGGSARRLLINIFLLGALVSAVLSNDATVHMLTPVVLTLVTRLGLPARPYVFACAFIANAASFTLPVSNPVNIVVLTAFPLPLPAYLAHLLPAALASIAINLLVFLLLFRRDLHGRFVPDQVGDAEIVQQFPVLFRSVAGWLAVTVVVYVLASIREFPLGLVAALSGIGLVALALGFRRLSWARLGREVSWPLFGLVAGLLVLIQGLENVGVTPLLARLLLIGGHGTRAGAFASVATAAVGSNIMNNLPATFVLTATIGHVPDTTLRSVLAYGTIIGADLGPNITVVGSLSTMLWLLILRRRDVEVSAVDYIKLGAPVTPLMLAVCAGILALTVA
ncbi:MAG TPA: SLC13 family permease [Chloroflexota bacterium]